MATTLIDQGTVVLTRAQFTQLQENAQLIPGTNYIISDEEYVEKIAYTDAQGAKKTFNPVDGTIDLGKITVDTSKLATKEELKGKQDKLSQGQLDNIAAVPNKANSSDLTAHINNKSNPHEVNITQLKGLVDNKIPTGMIPAVAITDTFTVGTQAAMLTLTAQKGDVAIRTDLNKSFILQKEPATEPTNWIELKTPDCKVSSVNGEVGAITLTGEDIKTTKSGSTTLKTDIEKKVDKISGKGLSTNDYDNTEKGKVSANTEARHSHSNKSLLDTYKQTEVNLADAVSKKHNHSNKTILDNTTESFTTAQKTQIETNKTDISNLKINKADKSYVNTELAKKQPTGDYALKSDIMTPTPTTGTTGIPSADKGKVPVVNDYGEYSLDFAKDPRVNNIINNTTRLANTNGGFIAGQAASTTSGAAIGNGAYSGQGGAIGENAYTIAGGAIGAGAKSGSGGAIGMNAESSAGGFSGGMDAKATVDAIQLGAGTNSSAKTLKVYNSTIMGVNGILYSSGKEVATKEDVKNISLTPGPQGIQGKTGPAGANGKTPKLRLASNGDLFVDYV